MTTTHYRITGGLQGGYIPSLTYCLPPDTTRDAAIQAWKDEATTWAEACGEDDCHGWDDPETIYAEIGAIARDEGPSLDHGGALVVTLRDGHFPGETYDYVALEVCTYQDPDHYWDEDAGEWHDVLVLEGE